MKSKIINYYKYFDWYLASNYLKHIKEKNSLIVFMFHSLFNNEPEESDNYIDSSLGITISRFREFIDYYLEAGYIFISPEEIGNGLCADKKYILITFDDGYFNNSGALPVLESYDVPALFFVSVNNVKENKCFWWDVIYREGIKAGVGTDKIKDLQRAFKNKTNQEIERVVEEIYGKSSFIPYGDIDRPFTPEELKDFSRKKHVYIGNHTMDHGILTNYSLEDAFDQICDAQNELEKIIGYVPESIAYPNGNYSKEIIDICKRLNLKSGFTTARNKNYIPLNDVFQLSRFSLSSKFDIRKQCEQIRSDIRIYDNILKLYDKLRNV